MNYSEIGNGIDIFLLLITIESLELSRIPESCNHSLHLTR